MPQAFYLKKGKYIILKGRVAMFSQKDEETMKEFLYIVYIERLEIIKGAER